MSTVSAGGESSVTTLTMRKLEKYIESFGKRLLGAPEEPVSLTNAAEVRKWLELAKGDVVRGVSSWPTWTKRLQEKIQGYRKELEDGGTTVKVPVVIKDGLDQYDQYSTGLRELGTTINMARSSSGASLRPEDSASHLSTGSIARSSVQGASVRPSEPVGRGVVEEVPVVDFKKPAPRPRTRSKVAPVIGSKLMSPQQVRWSWTTSRFRG